ncbi:MAG: hypothetical protein P8M30_16530 [Planctomycetaceae bacterium]|jgi:hypothetical protein|nr:hypothetical protein [bacterium]MDG2390914.1 hypothetical protein [Planctomycetaceae bacterium]
MRIFQTQRLTIPAIFICLASIGCGGSSDKGPELFPATGTVTFDGEPISEGRILFRADGGAGNAYTSVIKDGKYEIELVSGEMKVEIIASRIVPGEFGEAASPDEEAPPLSEMYIPEIFNTKSTLTADIKADGENTIPFDLKTP